MQVYEFSDYREYLEAKLGEKGKRTGARLKASRHLRCHSTYFSQVLSGKTHLSLEHAEALNGFFDHSKDEGSYFLLLVLKSRAGTKPLKMHFEAQIKEIMERRTAIRNRLKNVSEVLPEDRDRFYSSYLYGALHVLVSIPEFQALDSLSKATGLNPQRLAEELEFLAKIGLIQLKNGKYVTGTKMVHLGSDSVAISKHHTNWRFHAIQSISHKQKDDLHYSAVVSLSEEAAQEIKESLLKALEKHMQIIQKAPEEAAYVYNFDFYRF